MDEGLLGVFGVQIMENYWKEGSIPENAHQEIQELLNAYRIANNLD